MNQSADVAIVLALEEPAKALFEAMEAAKPAVERLEAGGYAGIGYVTDCVDLVGEGGKHEGLGELVRVLGIFRAAQGNWGAFDHGYYVGNLGLTVGQAVRELLDDDDPDDAHIQRVEAMLQYAAAGAARP
jgi:hypothetical protein